MSTFSIRTQSQQHSSLGTRVGKTMAIAITAVLLLFCAGFAYMHYAKQQLFSVQSGSMEPALSKGDLVVASPVTPSSLKPGDMVTYVNPKNERQTITHRITHIDPRTGRIQTKGDANKTADQPISARQVVGKVTYAVPAVGMFIDMIRQPLGLLFIVYVPALIVAGSEIRRLANHYNSQKVYRVIRTPRHRRHGFAFAAGMSGLALTGLVFGLQPVFAALSGNATLVGNSITTVTIPQSYAVCNFPSNESLTSYAPIDALFPHAEELPLPLDQPILPGAYKISAVSRDNHLANPNEPAQPNERWYAQLYTATATTPSYQTGITDDIPHTVDEITTTMNDRIFFDKTVTGIRYAHNAWLTGLEQTSFGNRRFDDLSEQEKRQVLWHSVHPGCITLERLQPDQTAGISTNQ